MFNVFLVVGGECFISEMLDGWGRIADRRSGLAGTLCVHLVNNNMFLF